MNNCSRVPLGSDGVTIYPTRVDTIAKRGGKGNDKALTLLVNSWWSYQGKIHKPNHHGYCRRA